VIVNWTDFLVQATIGFMSASDAAPLPRLGEVFFDVRGDSRSMRLSWYADTGVAVFSIWQGGRCTGTFRLPIDDLPRMIETLQRGPQRRRRGVPDGRRSERASRQHAGNEPGYYGEGDYSDGDAGYDDAGHEAGSYHEGGYHDAGYELGAQTQAFRPDGHGPEGYGPEGYRPDGYGPDEPASAPRSGGGHWGAGYVDSPGYPDVPGYGNATAGESSRAGIGRPDVPTGGYSHRPDSYQSGDYLGDGYRSGYQAERYQSDGYVTDGYQSDSYRTDGYQAAAYQASPTDQAVDAESQLAGYGEDRFVPPYVRPQGEAYPNDNPEAGPSRWQGGR
jgi:hypothetical protein